MYTFTWLISGTQKQKLTVYQKTSKNVNLVFEIGSLVLHLSVFVHQLLEHEARGIRSPLHGGELHSLLPKLCRHRPPHTTAVSLATYPRAGGITRISIATPESHGFESNADPERPNLGALPLILKPPNRSPLYYIGRPVPSRSDAAIGELASPRVDAPNCTIYSKREMATAAGSPSCSPRTAAAAASSFSRTASSSMASHHVPSNPGVKIGPNGTAFVSSGIPDLDRILGGGFLLGSLVLVMEDADAPHHLLLLRNFMSQGVVLRQPVLFASPLGDPRAFLGTLPSPASPSKEQIKRTMAGGNDQQELEKGLRIAWQYKKYFGDQQSSSIHDRDAKQEFSNEFDLRKPLERRLVQYIETISLQDSPDIVVLRDRFSNFLSRLPRIYLTWSDGDNLSASRIAIQSFCAPQCGFSERDWDMVAFIRFLKSMVRTSNMVAVVTFPTSYLQPSFLKRCQHLADTLLSVRAIPGKQGFGEAPHRISGYAGAFARAQSCSDEYSGAHSARDIHICFKAAQAKISSLRAPKSSPCGNFKRDFIFIIGQLYWFITCFS
ncbi:hypothetical protein ZIOFF_050261 [Zingiber officinale]|uniref:Elongator complex protein 4 n=1 Tax=Zingiber officinale TaxID=94328 RepID=A0A8J5KTI9_ZINOF|nr:hypothetical protein ZIOFF_050261 [Zingiber officinale]